jgi:hypothetical protein
MYWPISRYDRILRRSSIATSDSTPSKLSGMTLYALPRLWQSGDCEAVRALTRFGSAARGQPLYDGGVHLGRLCRTIFLIDYFTVSAFRGELQHALNRGEAVQNVQRGVGRLELPQDRNYGLVRLGHFLLKTYPSAGVSEPTCRLLEEAVTRFFWPLPEALTKTVAKIRRRFGADVAGTGIARAVQQSSR